MKKNGFTLIELLVVISIIALLLSVVMPALRKAKEASRGLICRSNLRQMSLAFNTYSVENDGKMFALDYAENHWFRRIAPYLGDDYFRYNPTTDMKNAGVMKAAMCPSVTNIQTESGDHYGTYNTTWSYDTGSGKQVSGCYGINAWAMDDPDCYNFSTKWKGDKDYGLARYWGRYAHIRGEVALLADAFRMDVWADSNDSAPSKKVQLREPTDLPHTTGKHMWRYCVDRHDMAVNVVTIGGSVTKVKLEDLWTVKWNKKSYSTTVRMPIN